MSDQNPVPTKTQFSEGTRKPLDTNLIQRAMAGLKYAFTGKPPETAWFGPLEPMAPLVADAQQDSVRARMLDYPTGYNLRVPPRSGEAVTFSQMRALADSCDVLRLVIETRKDQMALQTFSVVNQDEDVQPDDRCKEVEDFFKLPDGENDFVAWQRMILEDMFVLDAVAIYPWKYNDGTLYRLDIMDGATIKRVINDQGRTPMPPDPAYQQILKGIPTSDYTSDELIYNVRNKRSNRIYGYSPVEQIIVTVNTALRRTMHQLQFYTEGSTPDMLMSCPPDWNMDQVRDFNEWWNSMLAGNTAARRKGLFIPHGVAPINTKEGALKDQYDEWLARIVCYAFSVSPTPFVAQVNRATAESAQEAALMEGLHPIMLWMRGLLDSTIWKHFGYTDLCIKWNEQKTQDPQVQAAIDDQCVRNGTATINEVRQRRGEEPVPGGDKAIVIIGTGPVDFQRALEANTTTLENSAKPPEPPPAPGLGGSPGEPGQPGQQPGRVTATAATAATAKMEKGGSAAKKALGAASRIDRDRPAVAQLRRVLKRKVAKGLAKASAKAIASIVAAYAAAPKPVRPVDTSVDKFEKYDDNQERGKDGKWTKSGGQLGSNEGGVFHSPGGDKHYVKFPAKAGQIKAEEAADQIYALMGVGTMEHKETDVNGKPASASQWKEVTPLGGKGWQKLTDAQVQQAANSYVASALTKNWDVVGLVYDNMGKDKAGNLHIMDTGGSFQYRAQGGPKDFGKDATADLHAMLDKQYPAGKVFGPLLASHPEAFKAAVKEMNSIPESKLKAATKGMEASHPGTTAALLARRDSITEFFASQTAKLGKALMPDYVTDNTRIRKGGTEYDKELADAILKQLDLSGFEEMTPEIQAIIEKVLQDSGVEALSQVGIDGADMLSLVNENAVEYAKERAAELVTNISESTREMLRSDIEDAMQEGMSNGDLADLLADNYGFSDDRAEMIARTETAYADVQGNLKAYEASGVVAQKRWITGEGCCPKCDELDGKVIDLDESFDADGEEIDGPPFHPNCRCDIVPIVDNNDNTDSGDNGDNGEASDQADMIEMAARSRAIAASWRRADTYNLLDKRYADDPAMLAIIQKAYDPDQPRDEHGRWLGASTYDHKQQVTEGKLWPNHNVGKATSWKSPGTKEAKAMLKQMKEAEILHDENIAEAAQYQTYEQTKSALEDANVEAHTGFTAKEAMDKVKGAFYAHQGSTSAVQSSAFKTLDFALDAAALPITQDIVLFRGLGLSSSKVDQMIADIGAGKCPVFEGHDNKYTCTSSARYIGEKFAQNNSNGHSSIACLFHVLLPEGSTAMFLQGFTKAFTYEREFALGRGSRMQIFGHKEYTTPDGRRTIEFLSKYVGSVSDDKASEMREAARKDDQTGDIAKVHGDAHKLMPVHPDGRPAGDPHAEMPGDRPEAFDPKLTADEFHKRFGGEFEDDIAAVYYDDGTQSYGKLKDGYKPAEGYVVNTDGMVVKADKQ